MDDNITITTIKKNTINKSLKELAEKNDKLVKDTEKLLKNIDIKCQSQMRDALSDIYVKQAGLTIIKKCYRFGSEEGYTKEHVLNKCPVFELWRNNNIRL